jgi:predicted DNA-binding protein YlxM (UPF0122 family)
MAEPQVDNYQFSGQAIYQKIKDNPLPLESYCQRLLVGVMYS